MDNSYQFWLKLAEKIAGKEYLSENELDEQELTDLCLESVQVSGKVIRTMSWRAGSGAYISFYEGFYWGFDDAEFYGPFDSFEGAICIGPDFSDDFDEIDSSWTHEDHR